MHPVQTGLPRHARVTNCKYPALIGALLTGIPDLAEGLPATG